MKKIRNFSIIAHIDHGKSTLADRIMDVCEAVSDREKKSQLLDSMDLERERGITIKLNTATLEYKGYELNLIDTPGHVDFSYEVSRSLAASDIAVLLIDATQGVQAQTLANLFLAMENDLDIIPVINKIDLPNADIEKTKKSIVEDLGFDEKDIICTSGKTGEGVKELLDRIIENKNEPKGDEKLPLKALIFDSIFDSYQGVVVAFRIMDGTIKVKDKIEMMETKATYEVLSLFKRVPFVKKVDELKAGEVGFMTASIKNISDILVGDTITNKDNPCKEKLPGYKPMLPMVYSGVYPIDAGDFEDLRDALEKLKLNDASLVYEPETSQALGFGFRCGFLGLLHMEIIKERLTREFDIDAIVTTPSVLYKATLTSGENIDIDSPQKMPEVTKIKIMSEPYILATILSPDEFIGGIMNLCQDKRGIYKEMTYLDKTRVKILYELPLAEIVYDFFDKLKSITKGYASFDYEIIGYKESNLVKIDILVNSEKVDALSLIAPKENAYERGKIIVDALKEVIPRALFEIPIQASLNAKVIARSTVKAMRKDVLAKCYGGDVSRKKKLLEKQKKGKKKMKMIGSVELPTEAFLAILKTDE